MTDRSPDVSSNSEIVAEACAWVAQLESGNLTGEDLAALREWMGRSPVHCKEIREVAQLSGQLSVLTELVSPLSVVVSADNSLRKSRWVLPIARPVFASIAAAGLFTLLFVTSLLNDPDSVPLKIYRTTVGEYQTVNLSDGTVIKLNTDSQIEVIYASGSRRVQVVRGEAFFDVEKDPQRPFQVFSGEAVTQAIGTSFVVRLRGAITEIAVIEGAVAFAKLAEIGRAFTGEVPAKVVRPDSPDGLEKTTVILHSGQALTSLALPDEVSPHEPVAIPTLTDQEIRRKISWTEGLFDFSKTRLEDVVQEISRHNALVIDFVDPSLKEIEFGGMFRTGDVESLFEALEVLGIEVVRVKTGYVQLRKNDSI